MINEYHSSYIGSSQQNTNISFSLTNDVIFTLTAGSLSFSTRSLLPSSSHSSALISISSSTGSLFLSLPVLFVHILEHQQCLLLLFSH
jgi:hypothetical protein